GHLLVDHDTGQVFHEVRTPLTGLNWEVGQRFALKDHLVAHRAVNPGQDTEHELTLIPVPAEEVAEARRKALDMVARRIKELPPLREVDLAGATRRTAPEGKVPWTATVDPAVRLRESVGAAPVPLGKGIVEHIQFTFPRAEPTQAFLFGVTPL